MRLLRFKKAWLRWSNGVRRTVVAENSKRIAIISSDEWKGRVYDDLLLEREFLKHGVRAEIISWQDSTIDYTLFDGVAVASMWGYQRDLAKFEAWMKKMDESGVKLVNDLEVIRSNCDKIKQFNLMKKAGLPVIETTPILKNELESFKVPEGKFVIKPAISGGGENTFLVDGDFNKIEKRLTELNKERALIAQPFVPEISDGEIGVVMIDGKIVNAVRRFPGVLAGEFKVEPVLEVPKELEELCFKAAKIYPEAVYLRLDTVSTETGYKIMEIEAFEPQLYYYLLKDERREKALGAMRKAVMKKTGA